jgi:DNA-binding transcriptional MerR regulator
MLRSQGEYSLPDLIARARQRLEAAGLIDAPMDGRVSPLPDVRTVRYYATLGLLDRPVVQGRDARYTERHVLQLVAVKALQAKGLRLEDVQARLYGRSDRELASLVESASVATRRPHPLLPIVWREVTLEPGLKLLADERWKAGPDLGTLVEKLRAALAALDPMGTAPRRVGDDA